MLTWRWGGAIAGAALVAAGSLFLSGTGQDETDVNAAPQPLVNPGLTLSGYLEAPGIDPSRCEARCTSMRLEDEPIVHRSAIDARGRFEFSGLADVDHCVEIVLRANPALVVARVEYVRPGGDELVVLSDPAQVFGPAASAVRDSQ